MPVLRRACIINLMVLPGSVGHLDGDAVHSGARLGAAPSYS